MPRFLSPRQVVEGLMRGISAGAWEELHAWFSDDALVEYPFALPSPSRLEGIAAIRKYFAAVSAYPLKLQMQNMVVHETLDPEVVVAEWDYDGLVTTTNHKFVVSNITVTRVHNGKIVASRDYHNHWVLAGVLGRLRS
ncbi:MAG TPA: nuclear transport factor 2 family protein [Steroidobacteraceae bacterium]